MRNISGNNILENVHWNILINFARAREEARKLQASTPRELGLKLHPSGSTLRCNVQELSERRTVRRVRISNRFQIPVGIVSIREISIRSANTFYFM